MLKPEYAQWQRTRGRGRGNSLSMTQKDKKKKKGRQRRREPKTKKCLLASGVSWESVHERESTALAAEKSRLKRASEWERGRVETGVLSGRGRAATAVYTPRSAQWAVSM